MIKKLKKGDRVDRNWRTINEVQEQLERAASVEQQIRGAVAALRQRPKDVQGGAGGAVWLP